MCSKVVEVAAETDEVDDPYRRLPVRAPLDEPPDEPLEPGTDRRRFGVMWHFARAQGA
jgi:hypothetical protein